MSEPISEPPLSTTVAMRLLDRLEDETPLRLEAADLEAWNGAVRAFLDEDSQRRRDLDPLLAESTGLSGASLQAALESALGGWAGDAARRVVVDAASLPSSPGLLLIVLSSNLPGIGIQPLLPALALGRRLLVKSPSAEPHFVPAFLQELSERAPHLAAGRAAAVWRGGDREVEDPILERSSSVLAYGNEPALHDLEERTHGSFLGFGPMMSLAILGADVNEADVAEDLARDIALFDQRGCLSLHAILTLGDPVPLARALASALEERAETWPPGPAELGALAEVRGLREEAALRGLELIELEPEQGTVIIEPRLHLEASPGLRLVRIHPLETLDALASTLEPWRGKLQGVSLADIDVRPLLHDLGVTRIAAPGELQRPDAAWANGGIPALEALAR